MPSDWDSIKERIIPDWDSPPRAPRRPHLLTPAIRAKLVEGILAGLSHPQAAEYAGIAPATFSRWLKKGELGADRGRDNPEANLVRIIRVCETHLEMRLAQSIRDAAFNGDWRAAEALLKRRFPDRWGDRARIDHHVIQEEVEKLAEQYPELDRGEIVTLAEEIMLEARR